MIGTAVAQLRFAASLVFGLPFAPWALDRLLAAALDTRREFGPVGPQGAEVLGGPTLEEADRRDIQLRRFRSQAVRAARETTYYAGVFERLGLDPARLSHADIGRIPLTDYRRTFNLGIGMILVMSERKVRTAQSILDRLNEKATEIGRVVESRMKRVVYDD